MTFLQLIWTNLRRHRIRTAFGVAGISFAVAAMLSVMALLGGAVSMFERILSEDCEYIIFEKNVSDLFFSSVPIHAIEAIKAWNEIAEVNPVLFGIVSSPGHPVITCFGVEASDARLRTAEWLEGDPNRFGQEEGTIAIGQRAADFMEAKMNGTLAIGNTEYTVAGILRTRNGFEDGGVFMPLAEAQRFFHKPGFASIAKVRLRTKSQGDAFKHRVETGYAELAAMENEAFRQSYSQFRILRSTAWAVGGCAFLLGGLSVANTMVMSVFSRIREIAILRVCGLSSLQIMAMIFGESGLISGLGVVLGFLFSELALRTLGGMPALQGYVETSLEGTVLVTVIALAFLTSLAGAIYPAAYGSRIQAGEALRFE